MFYSLTGTICYIDTQSVAVDCSGVAYHVFTSLSTLKKIGGLGEKHTLFTYLSVREDAMELYGFLTAEELAYFKLLIGVSGVGPKAAVAVLSEHTPATLALSIANGDQKAITRAQGIGPKIAQRIILELKDKMKKLVPEGFTPQEASSAPAFTGGSNGAEALAALVSLGFSQAEANKALSKLDTSLTAEQMVGQALKYLGMGY